MIEQHLLSLIIFIPILGAVAVLLIPSKEKTIIKTVSSAISFIPFLLSLELLHGFNPAQGKVFMSTEALQFVEKISWIPAFNIQYFVGVDGLSTIMVVLTTLLSFLCMIASWNIEKGVKGYFSLFLLLETAMLGVFCAFDFFLFYVFWELMLLPMYFLIGIWGGPRREYAAIKFFIYTLVGSVLMLLAMIALYLKGGHTFDITVLTQNAKLGMFGIRFQIILFIALYIGFAIKIPMFPFHTWLPDAHVEAPTAISVILAGVLLKMGSYGLLRISFPILPAATLHTKIRTIIAIFALINIVYGAFCAMAQKDLKKLVAYSSISHMGYVTLGMIALTPASINGAVLQMFNHGTITAMLFLLVGVVYDRAHTREIEGFGGLSKQMPVYFGITMLAFFAALGLPGLSGFVSEALVFLGSFPVFKKITICATLGIIITAAYVLWTLQRMFMGELNEKWKELPDINKREIFTLTPLALIVISVGVYPAPVLKVFAKTMHNLLQLLGVL